jgi:hypothetical protein
MPYSPKDVRVNIDNLIDAAKHAGFEVTETETASGQEVVLDITQDPNLFDLRAHFELDKSNNSNYWTFRVGYIIGDGKCDPVLTMEALIKRLGPQGQGQEGQGGGE